MFSDYEDYGEATRYSRRCYLLGLSFLPTRVKLTNNPYRLGPIRVRSRRFRTTRATSRLNHKPYSAEIPEDYYSSRSVKLLTLVVTEIWQYHRNNPSDHAAISMCHMRGAALAVRFGSPPH